MGLSEEAQVSDDNLSSLKGRAEFLLSLALMSGSLSAQEKRKLPESNGSGSVVVQKIFKEAVGDRSFSIQRKGEVFRGEIISGPNRELQIKFELDLKNDSIRLGYRRQRSEQVQLKDLKAILSNIEKSIIYPGFKEGYCGLDWFRGNTTTYSCGVRYRSKALVNIPAIYESKTNSFDVLERIMSRKSMRQMFTQADGLMRSDQMVAFCGALDPNHFVIVAAPQSFSTTKALREQKRKHPSKGWGLYILKRGQHGELQLHETLSEDNLSEIAFSRDRQLTLQAKDGTLVFTRPYQQSKTTLETNDNRYGKKRLVPFFLVDL